MPCALPAMKRLEAGRGQQGLKMAVQREFDLLLLDLVLPECDGMSHPPRGPQGAAHAAGHHPHGPRRRRRSRARTGRRGGRLRRQAVQRQGAAGPRGGRAPPQPAAAERPGRVSPCRRAWSIWSAARSALADGRRSELSEREAELFRYLAVNSGRAISRDEILANVWRINPQGPSHADDRHAHRPAAGKAGRRPGRAAGALDGPRPRIHGGEEYVRLSSLTWNPKSGRP